MGTELIVPENVLLNKLEEIETVLSPSIWQQQHSNISVFDDDTGKTPAISIQKKKLFLSDFINKAINQPLDIKPDLSNEAKNQLYRLYLFSCQQAIYDPEIRYNPLCLGFKAILEMKTALIAILITYRLLNPHCPYKWNKEYFTHNLIVHKAPNGDTLIRFCGISEQALNEAITDEFVTDWLIYRAHGHAGIRTLRDIKNNLIEIPNFTYGGDPISEFSRFERKFREKENKKKEKMNAELETEFRKTLVKTAAEQAVTQMIESGMSAADLLNQAFNGDITALTGFLTNNQTPKSTPKKKTEHYEVDNVITNLLEDDS